MSLIDWSIQIDQKRFKDFKIFKQRLVFKYCSLIGCAAFANQSYAQSELSFENHSREAKLMDGIQLIIIILLKCGTKIVTKVYGFLFLLLSQGRYKSPSTGIHPPPVWSVDPCRSSENLWKAGDIWDEEKFVMLLEVELPGRSETDILKHIKFYRTFIKELFQISAHFRNLSFFSENKNGKVSLKDPRTASTLIRSVKSLLK